ncbi:MAG: dehydrogenase [Candidatus Rokuibacteriota bacterium]|nr:MAG: dehydrogenase [Candidatus Rokubacteria bacterium]
MSSTAPKGRPAAKRPASSQTPGAAVPGPLVFSPAALRDYTQAIFVAAGVSAAVASRLAASLVLSNQSGHDSHGIIRIPQYIRDIERGQLDPRTEPIVRRSGPAWALVDGQWALGHETARFAMGEAVERARTTGVAFVSTMRTNHIGRLGEWAEQAAHARMIGMCGGAFTHPAALLVAPHQGAGRALSTNPMAIGLPRASSPPLVLDFATSITPEGKVRVAKEKGAALPPGSLLDRDGQPATDPNTLYAGGMLLPFALHKGYALSFMVDALSVALSGADEPDARGPGGFESGAFFLAIDPATFGSFGRWSAALDRLAHRVRSVPPAPGFTEVLLPGDPEHRARVERADAIAVPPTTWATIVEAGRSVGVGPPTG